MSTSVQLVKSLSPVSRTPQFKKNTNQPESINNVFILTGKLVHTTFYQGVHVALYLS